MTLAVVLSAGACGFGESLRAQETVVQFAQDTPEDQRRAAVDACGHLPHATPQPYATDRVAERTGKQVRYRTDGADDHALGQIYKCLQSQPGVVNIETRPLAGY